MGRLVVSDKASFVGGSVVPAGTPFEVPEDAKLEAGTTEYKGQKPAAQAPADDGTQSLSSITKQGGVGQPPPGLPAGKAPAKAPAKGK
jgi:hypothetical protein